jgi:predicted DsbA family dithiol-disulfide isomerase
MFFQSSLGIRLSIIWWSYSILLLGAAVLTSSSVFAQSPDTVLATVDGRDITLKQVDDSMRAQIYPLQQQIYAIRKAALENLVTSRLLESEATARGISLDELRKQLTLGQVSISPAQVEEAYTLNASFFASMSPDEARERIRLDLENQARMKHYRAGVAALRKKWTIKLNFDEPAFVSELDDGVSPAKGAAKPAITIVEFSDFECPFCGEVQHTLNQIMQSYGNEVRLVFKHMPSEGHRNSLPAARAAYCAAEQDRFWQFHDVLFASRNLTPVIFEEIAVGLGLGMPKFQACLNSDRSRSAIIKDIETARLFRIDSTPSFLVNGKLIKGALSFADFQKIIERELNQKQSSAN